MATIYPEWSLLSNDVEIKLPLVTSGTDLVQNVLIGYRISTELAQYLIDYKNWTTKQTEDDGVRYISNDGTLESDLVLYSGQGTYFNGTNQYIDSFSIPTSATNMYYIKDGIAYDTTALIDFSSVVSSGWYKDIYYYNRALTTTEKTKLQEYSEDFFFDAIADTDCLLVMPMNDKDDYARNYVEYNEGSEEIVNGTFDFDSDWSKSGGVLIQNGRLEVNSSYQYAELAKQSLSFALGSLYILRLTVTDYVSGTVNIRQGASGANNIIGVAADGDYVIVFEGASQSVLSIRSSGGDSQYNIESISIKKLSGIYPIINSTTDTKDLAKQLQYGLQDCKLVTDSLGVISSKSDYFEGNGISKAIIPANSRTVDINLIVNPTSLGGDILSGGASLDTTGLILDTDNEIELLSQTITSDITLADGFDGTIKAYMEEEV